MCSICFHVTQLLMQTFVTRKHIAPCLPSLPAISLARLGRSVPPWTAEGVGKGGGERGGGGIVNQRSGPLGSLQALKDPTKLMHQRWPRLGRWRENGKGSCLLHRSSMLLRLCVCASDVCRTGMKSACPCTTS